MADNEDAPKEVASEEQPVTEEKPEEPTEGAKNTEDETGPEAEADSKDEDGFAAEVIKAVVNRQSVSEPPSELQEEKAVEEPPEPPAQDQSPPADTEPEPAPAKQGAQLY